LTLLNETAEATLIRLLFPEPIRFSGDAIRALVRPVPSMAPLPPEKHQV
jgi:hypothetical protein